MMIVCVLMLHLSGIWGCSEDTPVEEGETPEIVLPEGYRQEYYQGMRYGLFIPPTYDSTRSYPLITRLHGSGDTVSWDLGWYHDPIQATDPCFVLSPKTLDRSSGWGNSWVNVHSPAMIKTLAVIDSLRTIFNIDSNRLYIHGSSMGGFGVFSVLAKEPGMFAGAFSICGGGNPNTAAEVMQTPLWIFHGSDDDVVDVQNSRGIYQAILNAGGRHVRYTEYPGVGHECWIPAWEEPTLESWLLAQEKGVVHGGSDPAENLRYEIVNGVQVRLFWDAPSDGSNPDNRIWYYKVFRDGTLIAEIDHLDAECTYTDMEVEAASRHVYAVAAINYFFEYSRGSATVTVDVP